MSSLDGSVGHRKDTEVAIIDDHGRPAQLTQYLPRQVGFADCIGTVHGTEIRSCGQTAAQFIRHDFADCGPVRRAVLVRRWGKAASQFGMVTRRGRRAIDEESAAPFPKRGFALNHGFSDHIFEWPVVYAASHSCGSALPVRCIG